MTGRSALPRWLVAAVVGVTAVPVLLDLALSDRRRPFGYLAADAFYYLTVARNLATTGRSTFDGELPTNGYHPLWQFFTAGLYRVTGEPAVLLAVVLVGVVCVTAATWCLVAIVPDHRWSRALAPLLPIGPTALVLVPAWLHLGPDGVLAQSWQGRGRPLVGTAWAAMNGMESGFALVGFAIASWVAVRRAPARHTRDAALLGFALAFMTLSRLDQGLVAVGLLVPIGLAALASRRFGPLAGASAAFGLPIAVYLALNRAVFGHAMPISGRLKTTFPEISSSFGDAVVALLGASPPTFWLPFAVRLALIVVPAAVALAWLGAALLRRSASHSAASDEARRLDRWLSGAAVGVLALAAYDALFVPLQHQGHWYFPVSTAAAALMMVRIPAVLAPDGPPALVPRVVLGVSVLLAVATFGLHRTPHNGHFATFYYEIAPAVRAHYGDPPRIVSYDDGIVAFATGFPTLSGLGFTLDDEGVTALEQGRLLELAWSRGYERVTSLVYFSPWLLGPDVGDHVDGLARAWPVGRAGEAPPFDFAIDYRTDDGEFVILRITPRP